MCVGMNCEYEYNACREKNRLLNPQDLKLQGVMSSLMEQK